MWGSRRSESIVRANSKVLGNFFDIMWRTDPEYGESSMIELMNRKVPKIGRKPNWVNSIKIVEEYIIKRDMIREWRFKTANIVCKREITSNVEYSNKEGPPTPMPLMFKSESIYPQSKSIKKWRNVLGLDESWDDIIKKSTHGILDMKKFTSQYQLSTRTLFMYNNEICAGCGCVDNSILHAYYECPSLSYMRRFLRLNPIVKKIGIPGYIFNHFRIKNKKVREAIKNTFLSWKAYIGKSMTDKTPVEASSLHSILLYACARYGAYEIVCPTINESRNGALAGALIKYKDDYALFNRERKRERLSALVEHRRKFNRESQGPQNH